jgi:hypothetical protein
MNDGRRRLLSVERTAPFNKGSQNHSGCDDLGQHRGTHHQALGFGL